MPFSSLSIRKRRESFTTSEFKERRIDLLLTLGLIIPDVLSVCFTNEKFRKLQNF